MQKTKTQKGITLVALIITIIVLLILAVVAIRAVKEDGIIQYAKNARADYEKAQQDEEKLLSDYKTEIDDVINSMKTPTKLTITGPEYVEVRHTI